MKQIITRSRETNDKPITWWPSPAKINLFLHVCGQYDNGYHELQTLFQLLDFCDEIGLQLNDSGSVELKDNIQGLASEDNLLFKAANLLLPYRQNQGEGVNIFMRKHIPMGGGLGGGSSNAATVLLALNALWHCQLSNAELQTLGVKLGADVPIFVHGRSAFAQGIGEDLVTTNIPSCFYLVATPNVHVSTLDIFRHENLPRNTAKIDFSAYQFDQTQNDCEKLVCKLHPEVAYLLQWLIHYAPSRMTGTGASVFALFDSHESAQKVLNKLPENVTAFIAKGLNISPIHSVLAQPRV